MMIIECGNLNLKINKTQKMISHLAIFTNIFYKNAVSTTRRNVTPI